MFYVAHIHVVWADLPDHRREQWRIAARAVPVVGDPTGRDLRRAWFTGYFDIVPWADVPIGTRRRWVAVACAVARVRDGMR